MTGTAFSKGKIFMDFDSYKNQEWLRRRKLRLEQVRKQSNEIARALRQKVNDEEKKRVEECKKMKEEKLRIWKAQKLEELERKLKYALEGFGTGYKQAEGEPDPEFIMEEKNKVNLSKAQKRGVIAYQEEIRKNNLAKENLMSSIERKKMSRKREDLRSALVCAVPIKKQEMCQEANQPGKHKITLMKKKTKRPNDKWSPTLQKKLPSKNLKKKSQVKQKSCACKCQPTKSNNCSAKGVDTLWIDLNEVQISSASESEQLLRSNKCTVASKNSQKEKSEGSVEFYDFSSRYYCKSFKEFPHLVERVKYDSEELNANELAKIEEEVEKVEAKKKMGIDVVSQERGMEALRIEKVNRDYNNLISKLDELSKKEKILKSQQRNPPSFLHMNDERLSERTKVKQRIMESKFESLYYEAITGIAPPLPPHSETVHNLSGGGDYFEAEQGPKTRLSFSASNLKHNSPATSSGKSSSEASSPERANSQSQLLIDINNVLRKGRGLRKTISGKWKWKEREGGEERVEREESLEREEREEEKGEMSSNSELEALSPAITEKILKKCQESQTENFNSFEERENMELRGSENGQDDSFPVSTSTSYKSPPGVLRCHGLQKFLDCLELLSETEHDQVKCDPKLGTKVNGILQDLLHEKGSSKSDEIAGTSLADSKLRYYIERLLNMSRECIANLSVSSENISTPNITDLDVRDESEDQGSECLYRASLKGENLIRKFRLEKADALEKSIRNWKMILEKKSKEPQLEPEDVPDCPLPDGVQCFSEKRAENPSEAVISPEITSKYHEITKKCSERIMELSGMLDKVRKDKEKLLSSASGGSSLNLSKNEGNSERGFDAEEEVVCMRRSVGMSKASPVLEGFINRYNLTQPREETVSTTAVADSQSLQDLNESLDSWPDVMDELLKREILTSPFKWSDGELSTELTIINDNWTIPSSIESVIGNFRKEIDKIKPFSLAESQSNSPINPVNIEDRKLFSSQKGKISCIELGTESNRVLKEESSVESINHYLSDLGLNWAKSFLRKNAESRAMSSSSNSEKESLKDEDENYH